MGLSQSSATLSVAPRSQRIALTIAAMALPPSPLADRTSITVSNRSTTHDVDLGGIDVAPGEGVRLGPGERVALDARQTIYACGTLATRLLNAFPGKIVRLAGRLVTVQAGRVLSSTDGKVWVDGGVTVAGIVRHFAASQSRLIVLADSSTLRTYSVDTFGVCAVEGEQVDALAGDLLTTLHARSNSDSIDAVAAGKAWYWDALAAGPLGVPDVEVAGLTDHSRRYEPDYTLTIAGGVFYDSDLGSETPMGAPLGDEGLLVDEAGWAAWGSTGLVYSGMDAYVPIPGLTAISVGGSVILARSTTNPWVDTYPVYALDRATGETWEVSRGLRPIGAVAHAVGFLMAASSGYDNSIETGLYLIPRNATVPVSILEQ